VPVLVNGERLILTTGEDGRVTSPELPCITYFLVETEAPDGFNLAGEAFTVTVISSVTGETVVAEIPNAPGNILPETGGIGTTIFYVLGGLLAVGAGVLLIAKKRMDDDK
ncbi:MAG: LPXTG cell wall anchor domain-containing protein, partial [Clostridia bacterium]|nr:LPXTG cell wall anchor domain-containing protein [Clostridia bacterium]